MTVCIALICDNRQSIVAVADRMISDESLSLESEQDTRKIERIGENFTALTAGDALRHTDLIRDAIAEVSDADGLGVREVASLLEQQFIKHRQALAEKTVLQRVGLTYKEFLEVQQNLLPDFILGLWAGYGEVKLDVELLVAGIDPSGAHLYYIEDPGTATCFDSIGYAVIGSGQPHAESFLADADYSPGITLNRAIWLAYVAKRRSERAPGVGSRFTDILVITPEQGAGFLNEAALAHLAGAYNSYQRRLSSEPAALQRAIGEMRPEFEPATAGGGTNG